MLATYKKMNDKIAKRKKSMKFSYNASLEIYIQLIIFVYEWKHKDDFESFLMSALIRIKFRRCEISYVSTTES